MLAHHDVLQRNLLLFSHRHGLCERAVDAAVNILIALLGCDEPRVLVARCNEDEVVQANAVDTQRALISVFGAKLKTFRKLFFRHAIAPIRDNHCIQVLGSCLFDGNQDVDWACAVGQSVVNRFASRIAHGQLLTGNRVKVVLGDTYSKFLSHNKAPYRGADALLLKLSPQRAPNTERGYYSFWLLSFLHWSLAISVIASFKPPRISTALRKSSAIPFM